MFDSKLFAANLRTARKRQGLSQKALADRLFLSTQAVSKWERGEATPDISHICRMAQLLGLSTDWLLGLEASGERALIAVDGGGSKTEFLLITAGGRVLRRLVLPGSNPNICSLEGACQLLRQGIDTLLQESCRVAALFIGGAGLASGTNGRDVEAYLKKRYPQLPLQCASDSMNLLAQAADPNNAIALICGTGSVVYATSNGRLRRFGGGGWRLETLGSGYDLGRSALSAALEQRDGTGPETALTQAVEQKLGATVWDRVDVLHKETNAYIASYAPLVLKAWQAGDRVASGIVNETLDRLAHLVKVAADHTPGARQVILGGSLLTKNQAFRQALAEKLPAHLQATAISQPPIWGACLQSARLAGLTAPDPKEFMDSYKED